MNNRKISLHQLLYPVVRVLNVPRMVCDHAIKKEHSLNHRKIVGVFIMGFGYLVGKTFFLSLPIDAVHHILAEFVAPGIHAIGFSPFLEHLLHPEEA